jgi:hypothetical protein
MPDLRTPEGVATLAGLLCGLAIVLTIGTLIGAVILRAAIALYNNLAGGASSPSSVPEPRFGKAMWIIFATSVDQMIVALLIHGLFTDAGSWEAEARGLGDHVVVDLISFAVGLFIMAVILSERLPTTFGRAIVVTVCYLLVTLLPVGVLAGIAILVFAVAFRGV